MKPQRREPAAAPPPAARRSPLVWVVLLLLALALLGQTGRLRDRLAAGRILRQVELVSMAMIQRAQLSRALLSRNLELLRRAAALDPTQVGIPIARGTQYLLLGNGRSAAAAYRDAIELEPRPEAHLNLARALVLAGEMEQAREHFRLAMRLDPNLAQLVPPELR